MKSRDKSVWKARKKQMTISPNYDFKKNFVINVILTLTS